MKLVYEINPQTKVEVECKDVKKLIEELTSLRESVGYEKCGRCKGDYTVLRHRKVEGFDYYEHVCMNPDCRAVLSLGSNQDGGTMYKKRLETNARGKAVKDGDKPVYLKNNGWGVYNPKTKEVEY